MTSTSAPSEHYGSGVRLFALAYAITAAFPQAATIENIDYRTCRGSIGLFSRPHN